MCGEMLLYTEPAKLVKDLKSSSSVPNALLGINRWDKPNGLSGTGIKLPTLGFHFCDSLNLDFCKRSCGFFVNVLPVIAHY